MHSVTNAIPTGTIASIPAKAHAHRALICAALANSPSTILLSRTSRHRCNYGLLARLRRTSCI